MIRVWFNHWFSTAYRLIELIKQDKEQQVYVVGTNLQIDSVIQKVCDEWYEEPALVEEEYIEYCLDFCKEHNIDVFVPRRNMVTVSEHIKRFEAIGVKVMVDNFDIISFLNDKAKTYDFFRQCDKLYIPDYYKVNNSERFVEAYKKLREKYEQICIKFVKDEGGMSFRRVAENVDRFSKLRVYQGAEIAYDVLVETLKEGGEFDDLMVMPYLPDDEISVDCLKTAKGLIAIPRIKGPTRHETIAFEKYILDMVDIIMDKIDLQYPCNIQFKLKDNVPYLLEINTRMSGGLQMTCLAADVNIPNIALNKILGKDVDWTMDTKQKIVSYIEMPQIIR